MVSSEERLPPGTVRCVALLLKKAFLCVSEPGLESASTGGSMFYVQLAGAGLCLSLEVAARLCASASALFFTLAQSIGEG